MGKIVRKTRNIEKFIKKIQALAKSNVESGYFPEQGDHPEAEMSYVDLAYIHAMGVGNFPRRDVREPTRLALDSPALKIFFIRKELNNYFYSTQTLAATLDDFGSYVTDIAKSFFGIPSRFMPSNSNEWADFKGDNTPLVFEGYLMNAWAYKTSEDMSFPKYTS